MRTSTLPLALLGASALAGAQTAGDAHLPRSPYSPKDDPSAKAVGSMLARATDGTTVEWKKEGGAVRLTKPRAVLGRDASPFLKALLDGKPVAIPLAAVLSIRVGTTDAAKGRTELRVTAFPAVTPEELVAKQSLYGALVGERVLRDAAVAVPSRLVLKGRGGALAMGALPPGTVLAFTPATDVSRLWWAIPSVTDDPRFPFREGKPDPAVWPPTP